MAPHLTKCYIKNQWGKKVVIDVVYATNDALGSVIMSRRGQEIYRIETDKRETAMRKADYKMQIY